jgi:hypothetical protein
VIPISQKSHQAFSFRHFPSGIFIQALVRR